jgi:DNA-binding MarR family transcriptional regulator
MSGTTAVGADALHVIETEMAVLARTLELLRRRGGIHRLLDRAGYLLLRTLEETGPLGVGSLAERVGLDGSTVTRQVAALERQGFATRRGDPADRRSAIVVPTPRGRELMREVQRLRRERFDDLLGGWTDRERDELGRLLTRLNRSIAASASLSAGTDIVPDEWARPSMNREAEDAADAAERAAPATGCGAP